MDSYTPRCKDKPEAIVASGHLDFGTRTTFLFEKGYYLTLVADSGPSYIIVEDIVVATMKCDRNVGIFTIGVGARNNSSNLIILIRSDGCYECEDGNEFHFVLMLC